MADDKTVVLRVQLDEGATEQQLKKLVLDLEATRTAQKALTAERKAGTKSDEEFAAETVKLQQQLKGQQGEYANLTKNLDLYRRAQAGEVGNYQATQAALSLAIRQQHELAGSSGDTTEASQALTRQIAAYREELAATDAKQGAFFRNIGNYPKGSEGLEQLVQQLVTLQEQQKRTAEGTKEAETVTRQIGFVQTAAAQAGAQAGLSYEQTTAKVAQYSEALRPAAAALVEVAQAEQAAATSGEATGETMQRIGFQTAAARKALTDATAALGKVPEAAEEGEQGLSGFGDSLADLDGKTGAFGGQVANLKQRFTQAKQGIELAKVGFTGLKGAIASTGIGVLVLALGALVQYFTQTDEGAEDLSAALAFLKGLVQPLIGLFTSLGKGAVEAAKNPKQAFSDLVDFLEGQVINRLKAFGVIIDAIKNGDFKGLANGVIQLNTGIEDGIGKMQALGQEAARAADAAYNISRAKDALEDQEIAAIALNEKQKQQAERLVLTAKDRNQTEAQRLANLDKAGKLETEVLNRTLGIEKERLRILQAENSEKQRTGTLSDEERKAEQEQLAKLTQLQGEYDKQQQVIENRRSVLQASEAEKRKAEAAKEKQEAEKRQEQRLRALREGYALENQLLDGQLRRVQAGSDQELSILQQKLRNSYLSELAQKDLTLKGKRLLEQKYQQDTAKLEQDFNKARILAAYDEEVAALNRRLVLVERGGQQETELKVAALEKLRDKELASLDQRQDNTERAGLLRANTDRQIQDTRYAAAAATERFIQGEKNALDLALAEKRISQGEYDRQVVDADVQNAQRRLAVAMVFGQQTEGLEQAFTEKKIAQVRAVSAAEKEAADKAKELSQQRRDLISAQLSASGAYTDAIIEFFGKESAAGQAALAIKKTLAVAEIALGLEKQLSANAEAGAKISASAPPYTVPVGVAYTIVADVIAVAAAATATANILKLQRGGLAHVGGGLIATGPSHAQGGIPLYHRGQPAGIEIEGMEPVLTANVSRNPLLLSLASTVNQLAGGRALTAGLPSFNTYAALGAITRPVAQQQLRQLGGIGDAAAIGAAVADALRRNPAYNRWSDFKAAEARNTFTDKASNS